MQYLGSRVLGRDQFTTPPEDDSLELLSVGEGEGGGGGFGGLLLRYNRHYATKLQSFCADV